MKKLFVFLLIALTVFTFVACKNEPANPEPDPEPAPEPTPDPEPAPEPAEPIKETGVLFVRPAAGATFSQTGKFQFRLDVQFEKNQSIDLHAKFSADITSVAVRQGGGDNTKFRVNGVEAVPLTDYQQDEDGWYIISIPAESVTPNDGGQPVDTWIGLGITAYTAAEDRTGCFVALKGLSLNGEYFDITDWDEEDCAQPYYTSPSALDVTLTLD